jgi:hypothetical protein
MSTELPEDILKEVIYFGTGGGLDCEGTYTEPTIFTNSNVQSEMMRDVQLVTCGWQADQSLTGKITYPDGSIKNFPIVSDERGVARLVFAPEISDLEGSYTFEISSGDGITFESQTYFKQPDGPRVYELITSELFLHNFSSSENIRVFAYDCKLVQYGVCTLYQFKGWTNFVVTTKGDLLIKIPNKELYYVVISSSNEQVWMFPIKGIQGIIAP